MAASASVRSAGTSLFDFTVKDIHGKQRSLTEFKDRVMLVVNVASACGYTPQYKGLQEVYAKYQDKGFVVLGFPCNQFGAQEPKPEAEIMAFCESKYNVTFPMMAKIEVNGPNTDPLYTWLKEASKTTSDIKWNFNKFLVAKNGTSVTYYPSSTKPEQLEQEIQKLLSAS